MAAELPGYELPPGASGDGGEEPPPPPPPDDADAPPPPPPADATEGDAEAMQNSSFEPQQQHGTVASNADEQDEAEEKHKQLSEQQDTPADDTSVDVNTTEAKGRGLGGGVATSEVTFRVEAKNRNGEKLKHGGDDACAVIKGPGVAREASVKDSGDGTYEFRYSVPRRGDYRIHIFLNGKPLACSPHEAFFTAPPQAATNVKPTAGESEAKPATVHVANISPVVTLDQLRKLFSFCGEVLEARFAPDGKNYAFLEFSTHEAANAAFGLSGLQVGDRAITVNWSNNPRLVPPQSAALHTTNLPASTNAPAAFSSAAAPQQQQQAMPSQQEQQQQPTGASGGSAAVTAQQRLEALNKRLGG